MNLLQKLLSRRQWMKLSALLAIQPAIGCSSQVLPVEGKPPHHTSEGFRNYPISPPQGLVDIPFLFRLLGAFFSTPDVPRDHFITQPEALASLNGFDGSPTITWIGHSTYLIKTHKQTILLDPFFSDTASPIPIGPTRIIQPGIRLDRLPPVDTIFISHNHYDHLDIDTLKKLPGKEKIQILVPLGLKAFFLKLGYKKVTELDWYQTVHMDDMVLTALPAIHFSNRGLGDRNQTLWCSWDIQTPDIHIYFAGDTAYSGSLFKEIGQKYGPFDLAITPIGAYEPASMMTSVHTNPEEAVQLANDVQADVIVPAHWGTLILSDEPVWEPPERYRRFTAKNGIHDGRAWLMKIGETRRL